MEENWGVLLVEARNAFNEQDWMVILWNIRHGWPSGDLFMFNPYNH
jgi:hypothetical protein